MRAQYILFLMLLLLATRAFASDSPAMRPCGEAYFEGVHLDRVATNTGFFYGKAGYCADSLQFGLVTRLGADTRTASDPSNSIFNDNYLFLGAGVTWLNVVPGVRLIGEAGYSFDLSKKINRAGTDFRTGWMSYHELAFAALSVTAEFYTEGLYVHRYRNFLMDYQPRLFWGMLKPDPSLTIGPLVGLNFSFDSADYDYNRFLEVNYGAKAKWFPSSNTDHSGMSLGLQLYGVRGFRTDRPTDLAAYSDFRILFFGYFNY